MARITKYLLLALIVAVAFNHAARAQEEEAPAPAVEPEAEAEPAAEEPAAPVEEEVAPPAEEAAADPEVGSAHEVEEDNFSLGSIKKVGSWLSKFGWWNIWKGIGLKKAGDWWKWDKIFKEDWWKKKWFLLGSPLEEESRMMLVLSEPDARSSMGINTEEDATYFLAPPGFENELAKRGIAVNPSIVPVRKTTKKHHQQKQQQQPHQHQQQQLHHQYLQQQPHQLQNTQYPQSWLQRAFPNLDVYDREGGQGSEIDSVRMKPDTQSLSRSMVASLRQQIPDIIPLGSSVPNTPMYAYDKNGVMQLIQPQTPQTTYQQYQMMNEDTQNPAVLEEYQQARNGYQDMMGRTKTQTRKPIRTNLRTEPEELLVPMPFPRSNSITTKDELERALNDEQTQKMLEQYARKNWKTIRKDAIILKFLPKTDMEARASIKRQACTMMKEQMPVETPVARQMATDHSTQQLNSAYARDIQQWANNQERVMQMQDQEQKFRQMTQPQIQELREELPQPIMQQGPLAQQAIMTPQEPRQMITQIQQQMPMINQEPRQALQDQTPAMHQQPALHQHTLNEHDQKHTMIQQEPRQWLQEQPNIQQMPRQWIQEQPQQQPIMMVQQDAITQNEPRQFVQEQPQQQQQQHMMVQQEIMQQNEPRQWIQEQQWKSVDPSILEEMKPRQMTHQTLDQTQTTQTQQGPENRDGQQPIVSEMGPQTEDNARFFKKGNLFGVSVKNHSPNPFFHHGRVVLLKKRPSNGAHYVTHNYNIYSTDSGHGSGGYGGGYGGAPSYGGGYGVGSSYGSGTSYGSSGHGSYGAGQSSSYGAGHSGYSSGGSSGYGSSPAASYGGHSYGSQSSGYGGGHAGSYGASHGSSYGAGHSSNYGSSHGSGYRSAEMGPTPMTQYQLQDPNPYRSRNPVHNHPILHVDEQKMLSHSSKPPRNQEVEANLEDHLNHNERTRTPKPTSEHINEAEEASRLASKYPSKRQVSVERSQLGNKKITRSRRSIPSSKDHRRSRRQVSYSGGQGYSTLESIPPSSLQKLREGYKENLKEITLQPNEDPAEALMRLNSQSIQEALYRASSEPIEVDGTPGHTVVHNEGSGQPMMQGHAPLARQPSYQNQWAFQASLYNSDNVRSPTVYNNGNYYPDSAHNETVQTVSSVPFVRNDMANTRSYGVQHHYGNPEQDYGNGAQQSLGMMMPQGRSVEATEYERPNIHPSSISQQSLTPRYESQFQNPVFQQSPQVLSSPSYFYQQPNIPQVQYQVPSAPVENYNQPAARSDVPTAPIFNYNQFSVPRSEVHQSAPIGAYNQFSTPRSEVQSPPIGNYNQFSMPSRSEVKSAPIGNYNQFPAPRLDIPSSGLIGKHNQFSAPRSEIPSAPMGNLNQFPQSDPQGPMRYSDHLKNTADIKLRDYIENQLVNPSTDSLNDLMEAIKKRLTTCCHKCKNQILKGITSGITPKNDQGNSDDDLEEEEEEECLTCKASAEFLSDLKSLQNDFLKKSTPKNKSTSHPTNDKSFNSENTFRYYRDPNAMHRQKATQAMWTKKSARAEDVKGNPRNRLNENRNIDDLDYDYIAEEEYDQEQKTQSHRSNQERNVKRPATSPEPRRSHNLENEHLQRSGYSHRSRTQTSKTESNHPSNRARSSAPNPEHQYSGDYKNRRTQDNIGYKRVTDVQGQRRPLNRTTPKENKSSGFDYEKQGRLENSNKNMGYVHTNNSVRVRKPKTKQEQTNNESPCKKIQKQIKELEAETATERLENGDDSQPDILVEKKAKLIELLYFLYEMSKSSLGDQCQKPMEKDEVVTSNAMSSNAKDVASDASTPSQSRRVKIPRKQEVKILDYSTVKQPENNNGKNGLEGKKVRSVENSNYSGEDW